MDSVDFLQRTIHQRLATAAALADVAVIFNEKGLVMADVEAAMGLNTIGKKPGACVIVERIIRDVEAPNVPGPEWSLRIPVAIFEMPTVNRTEDGTGLTIEQLVTIVADLLHLFDVQVLGTQVYAAADAVTPDQDDDGRLTAICFFEAKLNQKPAAFVGMPRVTGTASAVVIQAGLDYGDSSGAIVYYTTDGTYPTPDNGTLYGTILLNENGTPIINENGDSLLNVATPAPFSVAAGTLVLANAWKSGVQHSSLGGKQF